MLPSPVLTVFNYPSRGRLLHGESGIPGIDFNLPYLKKISPKDFVARLWNNDL